MGELGCGADEAMCVVCGRGLSDLIGSLEPDRPNCLGIVIWLIWLHSRSGIRR